MRKKTVLLQNLVGMVGMQNTVNLIAFAITNKVEFLYLNTTVIKKTAYYYHILCITNIFVITNKPAHKYTIVFISTRLNLLKSFKQLITLYHEKSSSHNTSHLTNVLK